MSVPYIPVTPEDLAAGYGAVVVNSYHLVLNDKKQGCLLIIRSIDDREKAYSISTVDLTKFSTHVKRELAAVVSVPPPSGSVQKTDISAWDIDADAMVTNSATGVLPQFCLLGMRLLAGHVDVLTFTAPMFLALALEIEAALSRGDLIDLSAMQAPTSRRAN